MYQSIFSLSNNDFNVKILTINERLNRNDFQKAVQLIQNLRIKTIFVNKELDERYKLAILKSNVAINPNQLFIKNQTKDLNSIVASSFIITKGQQPYFAESVLINAINKGSGSGSDSLIHVFEILKSHNFNRKPIFSNNSLVKVRNKLNETEALQLLDMLKINEKLLL